MAGKGLVEIPLQEYRSVFGTQAFSDEIREKVLAGLSDNEKKFLKKSGGEGVVAELLALKMKLRRELEMFQENFSSSEGFQRAVHSITASNEATVNEYWERLKTEELAEKAAAQVNKVRVEICALLEEQQQNAAAVADVVKADIKKSEHEAEKRAQERLLQQAGKDAESKPGAPVPEEKKKLKLTGKQRVIAAVAYVVLFGAIAGPMLMWNEILDSMLSPEGAVGELNALFPVVRTQVSNQQLLVFIEGSQFQLADAATQQSQAERALTIALKNKFDGVRIIESSGKALFITGAASGTEPRVMPAWF